jgi:integrase
MSRKEGCFMSEQFEYRSVFAPYFDSFLKMKDAMGYGLNKFRWIFLELDRFFIETGVTNAFITSEQIAAWRKTRVNDKARTLYDKYSVHLGHECYIPRLPRKKELDFIPYVFTHEQMERIFRECDRLTMLNANMNSALFTIPALIRFLYSTGVRIGEALSIKNVDIDYSRHWIIIRKTKNKMQRMVPVNSSLEEVMKQYESHRNRMPIEGLTDKESFFFVSAIGKPYTISTEYIWL